MILGAADASKANEQKRVKIAISTDLIVAIFFIFNVISIVSFSFLPDSIPTQEPRLD